MCQRNRHLIAETAQFKSFGSFQCQSLFSWIHISVSSFLSPATADEWSIPMAIHPTEAVLFMYLMHGKWTALIYGLLQVFQSYLVTRNLKHIVLKSKGENEELDKYNVVRLIQEAYNFQLVKCDPETSLDQRKSLWHTWSIPPGVIRGGI